MIIFIFIFIFCPNNSKQGRIQYRSRGFGKNPRLLSQTIYITSVDRLKYTFKYLYFKVEVEANTGFLRESAPLFLLSAPLKAFSVQDAKLFIIQDF